MSIAAVLERQQAIDRVRRRVSDHPRSSKAALWTLAGVVCLARSWQLGVDSNFDLRMYHLYKSTSVLNGRLFEDVAAAGLGTYLNPLIDLPFGVFVIVFGPERGILIGTAVVQFVCFVAVWRLARALARADDREPVVAVVIFVLAITGSCAVSIAFTTFGDWAASAALCEAFTRLVAVIAPGHTLHARLRRSALVMGLWTGLAVGLKLTTAPIALGLGAAAVSAIPVRLWVPSLIGAVAGFAASAGPWMAYLQWRYSSPLFPFYNDYFNAPSALADQNIEDHRFGTTTIRGIAEFPAEMMRGSAKYAEYAFQDWRYLVALALLAAWACIDWRAVLADRLVRAAFVTLLVSYVVWAVQFGIYRYFLFGELLTSAMVVLLAFRVLAGRTHVFAALPVVWVLGFGFTQAPDWGRDLQLHSDTLARAIAAAPTEPRLVVISAPPPVTYLLGEFPASVPAISLTAMNGGGVLYAAEIKHETDALISDALADDGVYAIVESGTTPLLAPLDRHRVADCAAFDSNGRTFDLCRVDAP